MYASEKIDLFRYLSEPEVRHMYVDSTIRRLLAAKIKALRAARGYNQTRLGEMAGGMRQTVISRLEDPNYAKMTLETLKRLSRAFDVALLVDFVPFSELVNRTIDRTEADLAPAKYSDENPYLIWATEAGSPVVDGEAYERKLLHLTAEDGSATKIGAPPRHYSNAVDISGGIGAREAN